MRQSRSGILRNAGGSSIGNGTTRLSVKGNKKPAVDRVPVLPVMGHFYFKITNWSTKIKDQWPHCPVLCSDVCQLYGNCWQLLVFPNGSYNDDNLFVEVQLVNRTNREIVAKYSISVMDHSSGKYEHSWSDPDECVLFKPHGDEDDSWGNHQYIARATLEAPPYTQNDSVTFKVEIVANIDDELGALTPTTSPMGDVKPGTSLQIAQAELQQLSTHMSEQKVRMIKEEERVQDSLVRNRVYSMKTSMSNTSLLNCTL